MDFSRRIRRWRDWAPVPLPREGVSPIRWLLLEANRLAATGALLTLVFLTFMSVGSVWTIEIQRLLTETGTVQTILNTLLSGIILLVSIVVSINSIVLSHDITSVETQWERVDAVMDYRRKMRQLTPGGRCPSDPASFLDTMVDILTARTDALTEAGGDTTQAEGLDEYVEAITETLDRLNRSLDEVSGAEFGVLWVGLEVDYGSHLDPTRVLGRSNESEVSEDLQRRLEDLVEAFKVFAVGREYFKSLYYGREISNLSRTLLVVSLPAILVNATSILAIDADLLPNVWLFGLPPLLTFVAAVLTVSLAPYIVLTAYMLRLATVARRTAQSGPFELES